MSAILYSLFLVSIGRQKKKKTHVNIHARDMETVTERTTLLVIILKLLQVEQCQTQVNCSRFIIRRAVQSYLAL